MSREELLEKLARFLVRSRGASVVASDAEWPLTVEHYRSMCARCDSYVDGRSLVNDAFRGADATLAAIHDAGFAVVPYACQPIILAHGWAAINAGRKQPVDMAPGPALREAWPAMLSAADLARAPASALAQEEG